MTEILALLLFINGTGTLLFWFNFFSGRVVSVTKQDWFFRFERSFPPADFYMSACCFLGAFGLLANKSYGLIFSLLAASALIFLALLDITFNTQNKLYQLRSREKEKWEAGIFNLLINFWSLLFGLVTIIFLSTHLESLI